MRCMYCAGTGFLCRLNGPDRACPVGCEPPPVEMPRGDRPTLYVRCLAAIRDEPAGLTSTQIAARIGAAAPSVRGYLPRMRRQGEVVVLRRNPSGSALRRHPSSSTRGPGERVYGIGPAAIPRLSG